MPAPNPFYEGGAENMIDLPGDISREAALDYADDLISGIDDSADAYVSPILIQLAGESMTRPDEFVHELFALGVQESLRRMQLTGPPCMPERETIPETHNEYIPMEKLIRRIALGAIKGYLMMKGVAPSVIDAHYNNRNKNS